MNALELTANLIDQIILPRKLELGLLVCELNYNQGKRKADLVYLDSDGLTAFEVKSEKDTLNRLTGQIEHYLASFEKVFVVTSVTHFDELRRVLPSRIGIVVEHSGKLSIYRQAKPRKRLNAVDRLSFLTKKDLARLAGVRSSQVSSYTYKELLNIAIDKSTQGEIKAYVLDTLHEKHYERFSSFLKEKGEKTHVDDLLLLSRKKTRALISLRKNQR